ncbi:MAG: hypothetical protein F4Z33_09645, partial [Gemmatimonadales bacterium]|nr:hypothetical protein [Gemmatimonadales bacterium]
MLCAVRPPAPCAPPPRARLFSAHGKGVREHGPRRGPGAGPPLHPPATARARGGDRRLRIRGGPQRRDPRADGGAVTDGAAASPPIGTHGLDWLDEEAPDGDIVISSRVRLARNLQGYSFSAQATGEEREALLEKARAATEAAGVLEAVDFWEVSRLDPVDRLLLLERRLVSKELIGKPETGPRRGSGLALSRTRALGMMVNEEDHLRLQTLRGGFQLVAAWRDLDQLDEEVGARLPYAYHQEFGFLTSCPTNVGTGLRASVFIHLPGLVLTRQIRKVLEGMGQLGVTYRGLYGEGSRIVGNLFQISNQTTLGKTEEDLIDQLERLVGRVIG